MGSKPAFWGAGECSSDTSEPCFSSVLNLGYAEFYAVAAWPRHCWYVT